MFPIRLAGALLFLAARAQLSRLVVGQEHGLATSAGHLPKLPESLDEGPAILQQCRKCLLKAVALCLVSFGWLI